MRGIILIISAMLMVFAAAGAAIADDEVFGIYADLAATTPDATFTGTGEMYLCVNNVTRSAGISGWECSASPTVNGAVGSQVWTYQGGGVNLYADPVGADFGKFDVTVGTGLDALVPVGGVVHLATFSCFVANEAAFVTFTIQPLAGSTETPLAPQYFDKDDLDTNYACGNSNGGEPGETGSAWWATCGSINAGVTIDDEASTWSDVKSLYR